MTDNAASDAQSKNDEWIERLMIQMKEKNAKIIEKHKLVERDRITAENRKAAVTVGAKVVLFPAQKDGASHQSHAAKRTEREWDIGKASDGDWSSFDQEFKYTRPSKRGGCSYGRQCKKEPNTPEWKKQHTYGSNRKSGNLQTFVRSHDSNQQSQNAVNRFGKTNQGYENNDSKHWTYYSKKEPNNHNKMSFSNNIDREPIKEDYDKVWRADELNEAQNKQNRTEKWVESISAEDWSGNDCTDYKENPIENWFGDKKENSNVKQHYEKNTIIVEQPIQHCFLNSDKTINQEKRCKYSTLDYSHREDVHEKKKKKFNKVVYQSQYGRGGRSSKARGANEQSYAMEYSKKNKSPEYDKNNYPQISRKQDSTDNRFQNTQTRKNRKFGNYRDFKTDDKEKFSKEAPSGSTPWWLQVEESQSPCENKVDNFKISSGTWSDQEDSGSSIHLALSWNETKEYYASSSMWNDPQNSIEKAKLLTYKKEASLDPKSSLRDVVERVASPIPKSIAEKFDQESNVQNCEIDLVSEEPNTFTKNGVNQFDKMDQQKNSSDSLHISIDESRKCFVADVSQDTRVIEHLMKLVQLDEKGKEVAKDMENIQKEIEPPCLPKQTQIEYSDNDWSTVTDDSN